MFYNLLWLLVSFRWCYIFIRKTNTPIFYYWLFYLLIYIFFTISFFYLLKYIRNILLLVITGSIVSLLSGCLAFFLINIIIGYPNFQTFFHTFGYYRFGLYPFIEGLLVLSAGVTWSFLVGPASLLSCYYTNIAIQKITNKNKSAK